MKTLILRTSLLTVLAAAASYAQTSLPLRANIPFSFLAGGTALPAGEYTVRQDTSGLITLKSADNKAIATIFTIPVQSLDTQSSSTLLFRRYGDTYMLSKVWTQGDSSGREAIVPSHDRELTAAYKPTNKTIALDIR